MEGIYISADFHREFIWIELEGLLIDGRRMNMWMEGISISGESHREFTLIEWGYGKVSL